MIDSYGVEKITARRVLFTVVCFALKVTVTITTARAEVSSEDFERSIAPILINHCLECHHGGKASGGLNLSKLEALLKGGETGPAIDFGKLDASLLLNRVISGEMPPQENGKRQPLAQDDVAKLRKWIVSGAEWPRNRELGLHEQSVRIDAAREFWSFQSIRRPLVPPLKESEHETNPIDAFVFEKLATAGLKPGMIANPRQRLRRASLDLIGLPPSLTEQDAFLANSSQESYIALIDQLLANRGYGERWARYWLDLVRYADSNGYERDGAKPSVWKYRDYVINSLNNDKPYDRFVVEQLAGDELSDRTAETVIATGFHALGAWQDEVDPLEAAQYRADELDDMLRTTSQTFLGITIGCARCHNHKFDPISMVDYYSLSAILAPLKRPNAGREDRDRSVGSLAELAAIQIRDKRIAELKQASDELRLANEREWLETGQSKLPAEVLATLRLAAKDRAAKQVEVVQKHATEWQAEITAALSEERRRHIAEHEQAIKQLRAETPDLPRAYFSIEDAPVSPPTFLLLSGRASNPGPQMQPAVPVVLTQSQPEFIPLEMTSGRRLAFARWVVDPANPLTARVIVNRVWQHHFGEGLVRTPSDFGKIGARPTHPELLDWLADWFVHDAHWSLKKLHRLIITSRTYQATSVADADQFKIDPENKLLGRFPHRRLDVETIRDSILATSGKLNREMHGPAVFFPIPASVVDAHTDKDAAWKTSLEPAIFRRTVYGFVKRTLLVPMLEVLDLCDTTNSTEKRAITSIAPQALTLFNGEFVNQQAAFLAERILRDVGTNPALQIDRAYRLALCRPPTETETTALISFLDDESRVADGKPESEARRTALIQMCRVILNLNEFVYVE